MSPTDTRLSWPICHKLQYRVNPDPACKKCKYKNYLIGDMAGVSFKWKCTYQPSDKRVLKVAK